MGAMAELGPADRQVLTMTLIDGMKPGEIAQKTGLAPDVVRTRKLRAVRRILEALEGRSRNRAPAPLTLGSHDEVQHDVRLGRTLRQRRDARWGALVVRGALLHLRALLPGGAGAAGCDGRTSQPTPPLPRGRCPGPWCRRAAWCRRPGWRSPRCSSSRSAWGCPFCGCRAAPSKLPTRRRHRPSQRHPRPYRLHPFHRRRRLMPGRPRRQLPARHPHRDRMSTASPRWPASRRRRTSP